MTGLAVGGAAITVSFAGLTSVKSVVVLLAGTYRLLGTASDNGVPLAGVRVAVTSGPFTGTVTTADPHYAFWGLSGDIEILATKDGYREARRRITMTKDPERLDVELVPLSTDIDVSGVYALTVTASAECGRVVPDAARVKTFNAVLTQEGSRVTATLEGPDYLSWNSRVYNSFKGTLAGNRLTFHIGEGDFYEWPDVSQYLTPPMFYYLGGTVALSGTLPRFEGLLSGTVGVGEYNEFRFVVSSSCRSTSHRFELIRR